MSRENNIKNCLDLKNFSIKENSSNSWIFSFASEELSKEEICAKTKETFGVSDKDFDEKFKEATSGDGQEYKKITNIKSSSLCALLFFYSVSKSNPIYIDGVKYTESYFEVKNRVFNNPSNMDVVLIGEKDNKKYILFIECKFSEYLYPGVIEISNAYRENEISERVYSKAIEKKIFEKIDKPNGKEGYGYYKASQYMGGLKQIISHYVGLTNFLARNKDEYMINERKIYRENIYKNSFDNVSFVEVIFDFKDTFANELKRYKKESEKLIEIIRPLEKRINFLGTKTYQSILNDDKNESFKNNLKSKIKEYYRY